MGLSGTDDAAAPGFDLEAVLAAMRQSKGYLDITPADALELYRLAWEHARGARAGAPARAFMTSPAVSVAPGLPAPDLARLLAERGISGAPVAEAGRVLGVVSIKDFLPHLGLERHATPMALVAGLVSGRLLPLDGLAGLTAGRIMTTPALTIEAQTPLGEAARLMDQRRINRLPVVEAGLLVGIITRDDLVRALRGAAERG